MKRFLTPALLCAPVLALCPTASAQEAPALTPEQTASIMKQLEQIEGQITKNRGDALSAALTRFRAAMNGDKEAIDLWLACNKLENFDKRDLKATEFQTWKDQQDNRMKDLISPPVCVFSWNILSSASRLKISRTSRRWAQLSPHCRPTFLRPSVPYRPP
ncbi:hypothetical protein [Verrucomicrobium spinosum]|uniref:hypothetical protein n=1 Tax=Verrucomicrobium spinosum TaxID=2736 RepID=UPI001C490424|nr:hypothetical protein [Verrucomicrobium spinosum]